MTTWLYDSARKINSYRKQRVIAKMDTVLSGVRRIERVHPIKGRRVVAMTFDDGPCAKDFMGVGKGLTQNILDILDCYGAKGTFDIIGTTEECYPDKSGAVGSALFGGIKFDHYPCFGEDFLGGAKNNSELIRRIIQEGHELTNHSWSHRLFGRRRAVYSSRIPWDTRVAIFTDLSRLHSYILNNFGYTMKFGRPPHYVDKTKDGASVYDAYRLLGYNYLAASYDGDGWKPQSTYREEVNSMVLPMQQLLQEDPDALNGQIIFQKDGCNMNLRTPIEDALPVQLEMLKRNGYEILTVSEMLELSPFIDMSPDSMAMPYVQSLLRRGHLVGYQNNTFHGERILSLDDLLLMLATQQEVCLNGDLGTYSTFKQEIHSADGNTLLDLAMTEGVEVDERIFKDKPGITRTDAVQLIAGVVEKREVVA